MNKWELKNIGDEVKNFTDLWEDANKTKHTDQVDIWAEKLILAIRNQIDAFLNCI